MQEKLTIARPYAAAAFDYAAEHSDVDAWAAMLEALAVTVEDPQLARFIGHPKVSDEQMMSILNDVLGARLDDARRNFLGALLHAERLEIAPQIATLFERRRADSAGVVHVEVTSAYALNSAEEEKIRSAIKARYGRECAVQTAVDDSLIGGAVIKVGDSVIDLSLRGRLAALELQIA